MIENEKQLKEILVILEKEGILGNIVLIGSWCLLFYKSIFINFEPTVRTTDIDFFVPNPRAIKEKNNIIASLKEINYDIVRDTLTSKSTFISPDGFELEFLTKINREQLACLKLGNTNIYAESLPYLTIFSGNYIEIDYDGIKVKVASPASYILQKLLINSSRKDKKEKDIESIKNVLSFVKESRKYNDELNSLYNSLPKNWQKKINQTTSQNNIQLF